MTGSCVPTIGIAYSFKALGATTSNPIVFYFTTGGQLSGISVDIFGATALPLSLQPYWVPVAGASQRYRLTVAFRPSSEICSGATSDMVIGDRVVINPATIALAMPLLEKEALAANFTQGSCIGQMGTHFFYDLASAPQMSWIGVFF